MPSSWEEGKRDRAVEVAEAAQVRREIEAEWSRQHGSAQKLHLARRLTDANSTLFYALDAYREAMRRAESMRGIDGGG